MNPVPVNLAVEDRLSEAVLLRLLLHSRGNFAVGTVHRRGGFGYLRKTAPGWNQAAAGIPFILLTDLDAQYDCPQALIDDWLETPRHPNLLLRVAVREVESWLLADRQHLAAFTAAIGPEYNDCLSEFVQSGWDVDAAARASDSLHHAVNRIRDFRPAWRLPPA